MEEVAELSELMEEALGLLFRVERLRELLALVGVVQGKPMRVTLWTGANSPNLGKHWKYLRRDTRVHDPAVFKQMLQLCLCSTPGSCHGSVVLPQRLIQLHSTPVALRKVRLSQKPNHSCLGPAHLKQNNVDWR